MLTIYAISLQHYINFCSTKGLIYTHTESASLLTCLFPCYPCLCFCCSCYPLLLITVVSAHVSGLDLLLLHLLSPSPDWSCPCPCLSSSFLLRSTCYPLPLTALAPVLVSAPSSVSDASAATFPWLLLSPSALTLLLLFLQSWLDPFPDCFCLCPRGCGAGENGLCGVKRWRIHAIWEGRIGTKERRLVMKRI